MTLLHVLAWTGVAIVALILLAGIAFAVRLVPLVRQDRELDQLEAEAAGDDLARHGRQFKPYVPPQQPHRTWSDVKDDRKPPHDPAP